MDRKISCQKQLRFEKENGVNICKVNLNGKLQADETEYILPVSAIFISFNIHPS